MTRSETAFVLGSGGREHALVWKLSQSDHIKKIVAVPGNDAMNLNLHSDCEFSRADYDPSNPAHWNSISEELARCRSSLCVVGPDEPLSLGIVDHLKQKGQIVFGPTQAAARVESSKAFAKNVMLRASVPTAKAHVFDSPLLVEDFLKKNWTENALWVVKADGLALGKGVIVPASLDEALLGLQDLAKSHSRFLVESRLSGREISAFALCDGEDFRVLAVARDYKRVDDGDKGPNTGGMGAISPLPEDVSRLEIESRVFKPFLDELKKIGCPFQGLLYAGLMVCDQTNEVSVIEFNARFGDPETQAILPRLNADFYELLVSCARGDLKSGPLPVFHPGYSVFVVAAAPGYPQKPKKGGAVFGFENLLKRATGLDPVGFGAGIQKSSGSWYVAGGRALGFYGWGEDLRQAREVAYERIDSLGGDPVHLRRDIGK